MKSVPIKVEHGGKWVPTAMGIAEDRFRIDAPLNQEIPYRSVVDLDEKKNQVIITAGVDEEAIYRIASVEKVLQILKKLIVTQANAYRLNVFFHVACNPRRGAYPERPVGERHDRCHEDRHLVH